MGFSPVGLLVSLAVLAPNLLLLWFPPKTPVASAHVPAALTWMERAGQALCLVVPAIAAPGAIVAGWAVPASAALIGYYVLWARYVASGCEPAALYRAWWRLPVPMALLPVAVFLAAAGLLSSVWIAASALILAIGHVPASLIVARAALAHDTGRRSAEKW